MFSPAPRYNWSDVFSSS